MRSTLPVTLLLLFAFHFTTAQEVTWLSWEEAIAKAETDAQPKKIFVDVYTDWCGWCKKMDANTFSNPEVAAYMEDKFYMVKLDAEQKEDITYKDKVYKHIAQGRRGYHELAYGLLQGRLSFPTVVFMNEKQELLSPVPGYLEPKEFLQIARYFGDDIFLKTKWADYQQQLKK